MLALGDEIEGVPDLGAPPVDLAADVFMGHEFAAEVLEVGPEHRRSRAGHDRDVDPDPAHRGRGPADRLQQRRRRRLRRADAAVGAAARSRCPNGLDPRHAALTEPMAVGLHAVNRGAHRSPARARVVLGCGPVGLAVIAALRLAGRRAHRRRRLLRAPGARSPPASARTRWSIRATRPRSPRGAGPAAHAGSWCSRRSACPASSTRSCGSRRRAPAWSSSASACSPTRVHPFFGISKELSIQFVLGYDPTRVRRHVAPHRRGRDRRRPR